MSIIKSAWLWVIILCFLPLSVFGQLGEYYESNGHPKAKGLNFKIQKPLGFKQSEGIRPNIVQKWTKNLDSPNNGVQFIILVLNLPPEMQNMQKELRLYLKNGSGVKEMAKDLGNVSKANYYVIDNTPGICVNQEEYMERLDYEIKVFSKTAQVYTDKHLFQLQLFATKEDVFRENENLFALLANSVVFLNQYQY